MIVCDALSGLTPADRVTRTSGKCAGHGTAGADFDAADMLVPLQRPRRATSMPRTRAPVYLSPTQTRYGTNQTVGILPIPEIGL